MLENNLKLSFGMDLKTIFGIILSISGLIWAFHDFQFKMDSIIHQLGVIFLLYTKLPDI